MNIQAQCLPKADKGEVNFTFDTPYPEGQNPVVILTPCWHKEVSHVTSLTKVTNEGGTIYSDSHDYQIYIVSCASGPGTIGGLRAVAGSTPKIQEIERIDLSSGNLTSPDPAVLITSLSTESVKHIDTVDDSTASECSVGGSAASKRKRPCWVSRSPC